MLFDKVTKIVSGGQTGSDRAALDFGRAHNIPIGGKCPKGGWAEDFTDSPGLLKEYPELTPTFNANITQRTFTNVTESDATLIIFPEGSISPGTEKTVTFAQVMGRPVFVYRCSADMEALGEWCQELDRGIVLNVAGPRASECDGIYDMTTKILNRIFAIA